MPTATYRPQNRNSATDIYTTKDRSGSGYTQPNQPKAQKISEFDRLELQNNGNSDLWGVPKTIKDGAVLQKPKSQTVKAGKSTIKIRDDGSTIHYDSDTAIDLFDFLDFLIGRYGPSNEMAESVKVAKPTEPDLVAGAAQYPSVQGKPVMNYENMVNPPSAEYQKKAAELYKEAANDNFLKGKIGAVFGVKNKEMDIAFNNLPEYVPNAIDIFAMKYSNVPFSDIKISAGDTRNIIYGSKYDEYGLNIDGGKPNSFQHIYWVACLTDVLGEEEARNFSRAHETYTVSEYADGAMYSQDDIDTDLMYDKDIYNKAYPTRQQHAAMDLQNNEIGIQIALNTPTYPIEIENELVSMLGQGETLESLREQFPNHTDRQILFIKKAVQAVDNGEAAIIWDYPVT